MLLQCSTLVNVDTKARETFVTNTLDALASIDDTSHVGCQLAAVAE